MANQVINTRSTKRAKIARARVRKGIGDQRDDVRRKVGTGVVRQVMGKGDVRKAVLPVDLPLGDLVEVRVREVMACPEWGDLRVPRAM
jgi:hypothetical protein